MTANQKKSRNRYSRHEEHQFKVRGIRRDPVDIGKLSKALIGLAMAEAERQAQAEHTAQRTDATKSEDTSGERAQPGGEDHA